MVIALSISSSAALSSIAVATATTHSDALQAERNIQHSYHSYQLDTTLVGAAVIIAVALVIRSLWKKKNNGESCGCSCGGCSHSCRTQDVDKMDEP